MMLTRHGVRSIAQAKNLQEELGNQTMMLQIFDLTVYSEADMKKSIKSRLILSDGNNKITAMVSEKTFNSIVSAACQPKI